MAYNSIYTGPQIDEAVRDGEWYNLRCIQNLDNNMAFSFSRLIVIENYQPKLMDSTTYRLVRMYDRRRSRQGLKWSIPMFGAIKETNASAPLSDTYDPITGSKTAVHIANYFAISFRTHQKAARKVYFFCRTHNCNQRSGYALFKYTGIGTFGWQRVSNIVGVRGSIGNKHEETPATAINYAVFSE